MQQAGAAGQLNVDAQFASHQAGQPGNFQRVAQHILAVTGAVLQAADEDVYKRQSLTCTNNSLQDCLLCE